MAVNYTDFDKIWASASPLTPYEFSENNYKAGWNFVGATPPSRQMWDFLQKNNDEKMQYLANNYLPLSGGTMTGAINYSGSNNKTFSLTFSDANTDSINFGWDYENRNGAGIAFRSVDYGGAGSASNGEFSLFARDSTHSITLVGKPDGTLTWDGNQVGLQVNTNKFIRLGSNESVTFSMGGVCTIIAKRGGNYAIHIVDYWDAPAAAVNVGNPITVTHSTNSSNVTIKNNTTSTMVVQVIMSQIEW